MSCNNCEPNNKSFFPINNQSNPCGSDCSSTVDAACVNYTGSTLNVINPANNTLQTILEKLNEVLGNIPDGIDWEEFDAACLGNISSFLEFVTAISNKLCEHDSSIEAAEQLIDSNNTDVDERLELLEIPGTTDGGTIGINPGDSLQTVLNKLKSSITTLQTAVSISDITWSNCGLTVSNPTTIKMGFEAVLNLICQVKALIPEGIDNLEFDNTDCLGGSSTDNLETTINLIKLVLCDVFENTETLIPKVTAIETDIEELQLETIRAVDTDYFQLENIDSENDYAGQRITFVGNILNNKVAVEEGDTPDFLENQIIAGNNITITNEEGTLIIAANVANQVKVDNSGDTAGYLEDKIIGDTDDILTITKSVDSSNPSDQKVKLSPSINMENFIYAFSAFINQGGQAVNTFAKALCTLPPCETISRTLTIDIVNSTLAGTINATITVAQTSPSVSLYSARNIISAGNVINTGTYTLNSTNSPSTGIITIYNHESNSISYSAQIQDLAGNVIAGTTDVTGIISENNSTTLSPAIFGSLPAAKLVITLDETD